jgi:hypothetical protein
MNDRDVTKRDIDRIAALQRERLRLASLPPEEALNTILDFPQPAALVHAFPEEDLYFLVHDIGPEDALPLLSLASSRQLDFILDREIWKKDRLDNEAITRWFDLMMHADANRFLNWLIQEKTELLELYLYRNIEIRVREHDQDLSDFAGDYFTCDNVLFVKIPEDPPRIPEDLFDPMAVSGEPQTGEIADEKRREVLTKLLKSLSYLDYSAYHSILFESGSVLPGEIEENMFRLRNARLEEKGFLPFDEALTIYQPLDPEKPDVSPLETAPSPDVSETARPVAITPFALIRSDDIFTSALAHVLDESQKMRLAEEFAALCNQIIVADQKNVRKREELRPVVKKACGYVSIGMERMSEGPGHPDSVDVLLRYPLSRLFRTGFGAIWKLRRRLKRWMDESWFASKGLPLAFWDEVWVGVLGGLLIKRPLYFDNYETGVLYRDFESLGEIQQSEKILNDIIACDRLLSLMDIGVSAELTGWQVSYKNLLLTLWVKHVLGLPRTPLSLSVDQFRHFYARLFKGRGKNRKIPESLRASFLDFLSENTGLKDFQITQQAGKVLVDLFLEIESEYAAVSQKHLDPRFIRLFLIEI